MFRVDQLHSGLRIATAEMPGMESVSVGVWVGVGGRFETARHSGISHFIEHLLFKGTARRTARQISQEVEGIGGYVNAFTGEENTCYYAKASHRHFGILLDVLADIYLHPKFAAGDIIKERGIIKEELLMYRDQPDHYVHELLTETLWPDQPLGRPLTGTVESIDATDRAALRTFKRSKYVAGNTIIAVAGRCRHEDVVAQVSKAFAATPTGRIPRFVPVREPQRAPRLRFLTKEIEQTHLVLAVRGYSRHHPQRYAAKLLSVVMGENMSSRLFQVIRERHGLAYSIHSSSSFFADTGVFTVGAGLETKRLPRALRIILRELTKIAQRRPAAGELRRAKDYAIGQMRLGLESSSNQMMWLGEHLLAYGTIPSPDDVERRIEAVTADEVQAAAADLFRDRRLNAAVITPSRDEPAVRGLLTFG